MRSEPVFTSVAMKFPLFHYVACINVEEHVFCSFYETLISKKPGI
jgi:hypothetical protein